jgi:hypothetical protein
LNCTNGSAAESRLRGGRSRRRAAVGFHDREQTPRPKGGRIPLPIMDRRRPVTFAASRIALTDKRVPGHPLSLCYLRVASGSLFDRVHSCAQIPARSHVQRDVSGSCRSAGRVCRATARKGPQPLSLFALRTSRGRASFSWSLRTNRSARPTTRTLNPPTAGCVVP